MGTVEDSDCRLTLMGGKGTGSQLFLPKVHGKGKAEVGRVITNADKL